MSRRSHHDRDDFSANSLLTLLGIIRECKLSPQGRHTNKIMPPKRKAERKSAGSSTKARTNVAGAASGNKVGNDLPACCGYLIACDVPTKKYIQHLNDLKTQDKKFILEDLDGEHLLIKKKARAEIDAKVERWMDSVSEGEILYRTSDFYAIPNSNIFVLFSRTSFLLLSVLERISICLEKRC